MAESTGVVSLQLWGRKEHGSLKNAEYGTGEGCLLVREVPWS